MTIAATYLLATARVFARAWWQFALVVLALCVGGALALWAYARTLGPAIYGALSSADDTLTERTIASLLTALPLLVLFAVLGVAWAGAVTLVSDRVLRSLPVSTLRAVRAGLSRSLVALAVAALWFLAIVLALAATPVLVLAGLAGLVIAFVTRQSGRPAWLPAVPTLLTLAVPLGGALLVTVRLSRALPATWVDERGVRESLRSSWRETRGRAWASGFVLAIVVVLVALMTEAAARVADALTADPLWSPIAQLTVQAIFGSIPVIALAVMYRSGRGGGTARADFRISPRAGARVARIAGVTAAAVVVNAALLAGPVAPAQALDYSTPAVSVRTAPGSNIIAGNEMAISISVLHATEGDAVDYPTGKVTVTLNGSTVPGTHTLDDGHVSIPYEHGLAAGTYEAVVNYPGDANYGHATGSTTFTVGSAGSVSLSIDDDALDYGDTLSAVAHVSMGGAAQGGTVKFTATPSVGSLIDLGNATIDASGDAVLEDATIPPGDYELTAVYQGDAGGSVMSSPGQSFTVAALFTETTASLSPTSSPAALSAPGGTVTATVHVSAIGSALVPTGTIEILPYGGGDILATGTLAGGTATLTMVVPPGAQTLKISYRAGTGFGGSYTTETQYVGTWGSALGLAGAATSAFGSSVTLTATATSSTTPTGTVKFYATPESGTPALLGSGTLNGSGVATFNATDLTPGSYQFTAEYAGDGTVGAATAAGFAHTVGLGAADLGVTFGGVPTYSDFTTIAIAATTAAPIGATPWGAIAIYTDGTFFGNVTLDSAGKASLNLPVLLPGTHAIRVVFPGNAMLAATEVTEQLSVEKAASTVHLGGALSRSATFGDSQVYAGSVTGLAVVPTGAVQLWADGYLVGTGTLDASGNYSVTTTTIPALPPPARRAMVVKYLGDAVYLPAQSADAVLTEMDLADVVPVVTLGSGEVGIGGTYALKATVPGVGSRATGTVTFHVTGGADIGPVTVTGGVATASYQVTGPNTYVTASYSGDSNFTAQDSVVTHFTADRSAANVELLLNPPSDPNVFAYGNTFELVARVTIAGGLETEGLVTFKMASGAVIKENVPTTFFPSQGYGLARVTVCAGDSADCPVGMPRLGMFDQALLAIYPEGTLNLAATSSTVPYSMTKAPTSTSLVVNPDPVQVGSGIFFTATVTNTAALANPQGGPKPSGEVSFYGVTQGPSGPAEAFLGSAPTDENGVARFNTSVGSGAGQLQWPAEKVVARFYDVNANFGSSSGTKEFTVLRAGTSVAVSSVPASAGVPTTLTATVSHVPGYSAAYAGKVQFFLDGSSTPYCEPWLTTTATKATCSVTWATTGTHTVFVKFLGDTIYAPSDSAVTSVTVGTAVGTAELSPVSPVTAVALTPQTISWTPGSLTGTVRVYGGGGLWCTVDVSVGSCAGTFTNNDAKPGLTPIVIQYSGDATHHPREYNLGAFVTACRVVDVSSNSPSRGTVTSSPAPSCGTGGYPVGTVITATAHPISPNAFLRWRGFTQYAPGVVTLSTDLTTTFTVTNDTWSWTRVAEFNLPCYVVTPQLTGSGFLYASVQPNCTTLAGVAGYQLGTAVTFTPIGQRDSVYGVPDVFYSFGTLPANATTGTSKAGFATVSLTMTADAVLPVVFGTRCVQVGVTGNPTTDGDVYAVTTAPNCFQPGSPGFLPTTAVTVTAASANPAFLVGGWSTTKAGVPSLPPGASATLPLGTDDVSLTANWVACYAVDVVVDAPTLWRKGKGAVVPTVGGAASLSPAPNCPDASGRYLEGTVVTATPSIVVAGVLFRGWDGDTSAGNAGVKEGAITAKAKTVTVTAPTTLKASFYLAEGCSNLSVSDKQNSVTLAPTGCGPGYYADLQKAYANVTGDDPKDLSQNKYRSTISVTKKPGLTLDVYASVRGDATQCFGKNPPASGSDSGGSWRSLGPLKDGQQDCLVGGNISMRFEQCQTLSKSVTIVRAGDPEGLRWGANDLPAYLLVPTEAGNFAPMSTRNFDWVKASPVEYRDGDYENVDQAGGACKDAGNAFQPDLVIMAIADSISQGITFDGWTSDADRGLVDSNPVLMQTTDTRKQLPIAASYTMQCYHVTFGEGITIEGDAPRCPGFADEDDMFIAGTGIQIRAVQHIGKRTFGDWTSGVLAATTVVDPASGERTAIAYVSSDMKVTAKYPTEGERWENGFANGGKILAGVAAVVAPVALGIACPPCGIGLAVVALSGAVASLVPGGKDVAAFFDLINPTKITECAASWAFGKEEVRTGSDVGNLVKTGTKTKKLIDVIKPPPTAAEIAAAAAKGGTTTGKVLAGLKAGGKATLQVAAIGYGLYSAGIANADLGFETTEQLRDTSTMTNCLDDAWKFAS